MGGGEAGRDGRHADDPSLPEHIDPQARCLPGGVPRELFHSETKILQPPGYVVLLQAQNHVSRLIRLDDTRRPLADSVKLWMGESRGRWEGNTLVVDVANQNAKGRFDMIGNFATDNVRMVERWTIVGPDAIDYQVPIEDPTVYTRPFTIAARVGAGRARTTRRRVLGGCVPRRRAERRAHGGAEGGRNQSRPRDGPRRGLDAAEDQRAGVDPRGRGRAAAGDLPAAVAAPLERAGSVIPLTPKGQACLAIMAFAVLLWVTETVPFAVTSLLVVLLIPLFQLADFRTVVRAGFGDPIVTFFIGVLMLSAAFTRSGLGTRLVYHILERVGTRTDRVLLGVLAVGTFISMWITDMAVAAMLLPLGCGLLRDAKLTPRQSNFGRALMISTAFGPLIGGIATPAGTAANLVAIAQIKQLANVDISFTRWMLYGAPAAILMVPLCWRLLLWLFPPEIDRLPFSADDIRERLRGLGPPRDEIWTLATFSTVIAVWLATPVVLVDAGRGESAREAVALAGGLVLFLPGIRVMSWKEAERDIEWGGIMLIVAGLSLGLVVFESGAARWLAWVLLGQITSCPTCSGRS